MWLPRHFVTVEGHARSRPCQPQDPYRCVSILFLDVKGSLHPSHSCLVPCSCGIEPQQARVHIGP